MRWNDVGVEARAADERAVDVRLRHQAVDVVGLDAAAVQNPHLLAAGLAGELAEQRADHRVHLLACSGVAVLPVPIAHTGS